MKLKPIHILSGVLWLNFLVLVWCTLLEVIGAGARSSATIFMFFVLAGVTSMLAVESKGGVIRDEKRK